MDSAAATSGNSRCACHGVSAQPGFGALREEGLVEGGRQSREEIDHLGVRADERATPAAADGAEDLPCCTVGTGDEEALDVPDGLFGITGKHGDARVPTRMASDVRLDASGMG